MSKVILIVEDEAVLREAYEIILKSAGYETMVAAHGQEALERIEQKVPDVMLLDLFMPVLDGRAVLTKLNRANYPSMKIIVYSNISDGTVHRDLISRGADDVVLKSDLGPMELVELIHRLTQLQ